MIVLTLPQVNWPDLKHSAEAGLSADTRNSAHNRVE